jgi:ectoine hydroxylase-related dioxygenase (phytanoyl-CoA dioxygenase family)
VQKKINNWHNLPELSTEYVLSKQQIEDYQREGHVFLKEVATREEIEVYRPYIYEAIEQTIPDLRFNLTEITGLWSMHETVKRLVLGKRFAKIAADLMRVEAVRLFFDCIFFKNPGDHQTPWHQDQSNWTFDKNHVITMWIPLKNLPEKTGSLQFLSGSHKLAKLSLKKAIRMGFSEKHYGAMNVGDATFHSGWTLHSAKPNTTNERREALAIIYYAADMRLSENGYEGFFPGFSTGELAATKNTPVVYTREKA